METQMASNVEAPLAPKPEGGVSVERFRRISEVFAAPKGYAHYEIKGSWDENRRTFRAQEAENVFTEYKFKPNTKASEAQLVEKESYRLERDTAGKEKQKPVSYNFDQGQWQDKNILRRFVDTFRKRSVTLGVVERSTQKNEETLTLHTLELRRPTGEHVQMAESTDPEALFLDLELKAGYHQEEVKAIKKTLQELREKETYYRRSYQEERTRRYEVQRGTTQGPINANADPLTREFFGKARP